MLPRKADACLSILKGPWCSGIAAVLCEKAVKQNQTLRVGVQSFQDFSFLSLVQQKATGSTACKQLVRVQCSVFHNTECLKDLRWTKAVICVHADIPSKKTRKLYTSVDIIDVRHSCRIHWQIMYVNPANMPVAVWLPWLEVQI